MPSLLVSNAAELTLGDPAFQDVASVTNHHGRVQLTRSTDHVEQLGLERLARQLIHVLVGHVLADRLAISTHALVALRAPRNRGNHGLIHGVGENLLSLGGLLAGPTIASDLSHESPLGTQTVRKIYLPKACLAVFLESSISIQISLSYGDQSILNRCSDAYTSCNLP